MMKQILIALALFLLTIPAAAQEAE